MAMNKLIGVMCLLAVVVLPCQADLIVDTGNFPSISGSWVLWEGQSVAGKFTLDEAYTVTDVMSWMNENTAGDMTVSIYGDGGDVPDVASPDLYSHTFYADTQDLTWMWFGARDVSWSLDAGTYWAVFEVPDGRPTRFGMQARDTLPFPLDGYALADSMNGPWEWYPVTTDYGVGMRIYGNPVPVPSAALLGVLGLGTAGMRLRRRFA